MMKKWLSLILLLFVFALAGCSNWREFVPFDYNYNYDYGKGGGDGMTGEAIPETDLPSNRTSDEARLIIRNAYLAYETTTFDQSLAFIRKQIDANSGTILYSNQSQSTSSYGYKGSFISITARIPHENLFRFVDVLNANKELVIQVQDIGSSDVTREYTDNEARIAVLQAEETALRELLDQQGSITDILAVRERLNNVITEREQLEATNKTIDELADMSEVTITLQETSHANARNIGGFWERLWFALQDSFFISIIFLQRLTIFIVYTLPYLIIALPIYLLYRWLKKQYDKTAFAKKRREKADKNSLYVTRQARYDQNQKQIIPPQSEKDSQNTKD